RYTSASARRLAGSVTTTKCQFWIFDPVGACWAIVRHSSSTVRATGRVKSRRFRTARVVVSSSSGVSVRWSAIRHLLSMWACSGDGRTGLRAPAGVSSPLAVTLLLLEGYLLPCSGLTPKLTCCRKPQRSGGFWQSGASPCSVQHGCGGTPPWLRGSG